MFENITTQVFYVTSLLTFALESGPVNILLNNNKGHDIGQYVHLRAVKKILITKHASTRVAD